MPFAPNEAVLVGTINVEELGFDPAVGDWAEVRVGFEAEVVKIDAAGVVDPQEGGAALRICRWRNCIIIGYLDMNILTYFVARPN